MVAESGEVATMTNETHTLVASSEIAGRYALDTPDGSTLSSGQPLDVLLNGQWVSGRVEYGYKLYVNIGLQFLGDKPHEPAQIGGYYLETSQGMCGLCVGMTVRLG